MTWDCGELYAGVLEAFADHVRPFTDQEAMRAGLYVDETVEEAVSALPKLSNRERNARYRAKLRKDPARWVIDQARRTADKKMRRAA